ncbi:MAG: UTP--glucose-1-phosphate uridylyltransferase [Spirochaetes bacterium]|nr:UTP--glucose-1-phosphate uridylyltransferase [Spirochaetota bacterium]
MKGVIVAAGYGTRFLPVTKTVPKELLPLLTKPSIQYIIDEFASSGIEEVVVITSRRKKALDDYFDHEAELEALFSKEGRADKLAMVAPPAIRVSFVRQTEMLGTGHALLQAAPLLCGEPCVVAYPDDIHIGNPPMTRQLIDLYEKTGCSVLACLHEPGDVSRYGVIDPDSDGIHVKGFVEKPVPGEEPSHEISLGRYLYTPDFFHHLAEGWRRHGSGEYYHTFALDRLIATGRVAWKRVDGLRLDTGDPEGYLHAILEMAWREPAYRTVIERFMASR